MITASALLPILIQLIVAGLVLWLLWWLVGYVGLPEPFAKIANVLIAVVAVFFLIDIVLGIGGSPIIRWR